MRISWFRSSRELVLEVKLASLEAQLDVVTFERNYWKQKTEKLLDMALFRRQEITAPVFEEKKAAPANPMLQVLGAMNTREIDSRKPASTAAPVTPMT